jgi:hypothetical protein
MSFRLSERLPQGLFRSDVLRTPSNKTELARLSAMPNGSE